MAAERHYFVINQEGRSAHRKGPFISAAAAREWADRVYRYPCWIVPAEYAGAMEFRALDGKGVPVEPQPAAPVKEGATRGRTA